MNKRAAALLPAAVLALSLAGCGSSGSGGGSDSGNADEAGSASPSPSASSSATEPAAPQATGADYRNLLAALIQQGDALKGSTTAEQINRKAKFPQGVSVADFDKASKTICVQSAPKDISLTFASSGIVLHDGSCAKSKDVAKLLPKGQNDVTVTGDKALAEPVRVYFMKTFGS